MSDPAFPQSKAGEKKQARRQRQQSVPPFPPVQQAGERVILYQGIGNDERAYLQYPFAVDADRIFPIFPCSVRKNIKDFQPFQRKETNGSKEQENTAEYGGSADKHENDCQYFRKSPRNMADRNAVDKHDNGLQHPADAGKFHTASQHLKDFIAGTYHNAVKFPFPNQNGKEVKAAGNRFRKGKFHQSNAEAEQDFLIGEALHGGKTLEHKINAQKNVKRNQKLSDAGQDK